MTNIDARVMPVAHMPYPPDARMLATLKGKVLPGAPGKIVRAWVESDWLYATFDVSDELLIVGRSDELVKDRFYRPGSFQQPSNGG